MQQLPRIRSGVNCFCVTSLWWRQILKLRYHITLSPSITARSEGLFSKDRATQQQSLVQWKWYSWENIWWQLWRGWRRRTLSPRAGCSCPFKASDKIPQWPAPTAKSPKRHDSLSALAKRAAWCTDGKSLTERCKSVWKPATLPP